MSLTTCRACGGKLSHTAETCPHCGDVPKWKEDHNFLLALDKQKKEHEKKYNPLRKIGIIFGGD